MNDFGFPDDLNRFELGLEILSRLQSEYGDLPQGEHHVHGLPPHQFTQEPIDEEIYVEKERAFSYQAPSLEEILRDSGPLPPETILLGVCDEGLPILLDLNDAAPGSLLLIGDPDSGKTDFLLTALESGSATISQWKFRFACLTRQKEDYFGLLSDPHSYLVTAFSDSRARNIILEFSHIAEQRRFGRQAGPALVLVVDDLVEAGKRLDNDAYDLLLWLIENGPASHVYVLASINARLLKSTDPRLLDLFGAWIIGSIDPTKIGTRLSRIPVETAERLAPRQQFSVYYQGEWVPFWIPARVMQ